MIARIRLCGRLEVELGGERVEQRLPGRQGPLVLAVLAVNRERPVSRDELIGVLWPGRPPADPDEALSALLSKVRVVLGREVLAGRRELALSLPGGAEIDVEQSHLAAERARSAVAAGDWAAAWEAACAAADIVGRGFMVGHEAPWVQERRGELEELRLRALEIRAQAGLVLGGGHADDAERAAAELVREAPLREAGHRLLMEALAARGEVAEALAAYERLRVLLREELGTAPGEAVRALHGRLLNGDAPTAPPARVPAPDRLPDRLAQSRAPAQVDQEIRFCTVDGARLAYATVGQGPALVLPALWISHLELEWGFAEFRTFVAALARERTVIRYDRLGTGLSDREAAAREPGVDAELRTLEALTAALGIQELSLLGISLGGCAAAAFAARHPKRVRSLVLVGAFAYGATIAPAPLREALVATVRAHWGAGSRALSDIWLPGADADTRKRFAMLQRAAAGSDVAAALLEAVYRADVRELLPAVSVPALVVHRRRDRAIAFAAGRELAALLPDARLVALEGELHPPWLGDRDAVLAALLAFLDEHHAARPDRRVPEADGAGETSLLSAREAQVLSLVADGLSDGEIAERLIVSPHTVHRHVANIRTKLSQPSRAAAAAHAARLGLI